jgi:hypothetical protein
MRCLATDDRTEDDHSVNLSRCNDCLCSEGKFERSGDGHSLMAGSGCSQSPLGAGGKSLHNLIVPTRRDHPDHEMTRIEG